MQQSLFDIPLSVTITSKGKEKTGANEKLKINWSFSKMEMLNSCSRKYYYYYFGGKKRKAKEDTNKDAIAFYSAMSNKHTSVGDIVHRCIATFLRKRQKGQDWNLDNLKWLANEQLKDKITHTIKLKNKENTSNQFPISPIKELFDDMVNENELIDFAKAKINQSLEYFYSSEDFKWIRESASYNDTIVEETAKFNLSNIHVDGKIDVAFHSDGKFHIVDWKTSYSEYEETSVQLLVYALWAVNKYEKEIEEICIHKAYLLDGKLETLEFSRKHIERAIAKIKQSVDEMMLLEKYGADGIIEAFDRCDERKVCQLCQFEKICKPFKVN